MEVLAVVFRGLTGFCLVSSFFPRFTGVSVG